MNELIEQIKAEIELMQRQRDQAARQFEQAIGAIASLEWALVQINTRFPTEPLN
jgi:hypothetical protein